MLKLVLSIVLIAISSLGLSEDSIPKKYTLSIATIFKNEARYLKEWIEYHRIVGVEHFYLYNNGSTDSYRTILAPYIREGLVTLIDWPDGPIPAEEQRKVYAWVFRTQVPSCIDACKRGSLETKWLAMIDLDEFMVPVTASSMQEVLHQYENAPGVMLHWHIYGTSRVPFLLPKKLLIEALHMTAAPEHRLNQLFVKSIIKPDLFSGFTMPPHECLFSTGEKAVTLDVKVAKLNHYMNRTMDYFLLEKLPKKEHMDNKKWSKAEVDNLMNVGNDIEDTEGAIFRFVPELRYRMGFGP